MNLKMFTEDEKAILRSLPSPLKWIARDRDGRLFLYEDEPEEGEDEFVCRDSNIPTEYANLIIFKHIFKGVTFENSPIKFRSETLDSVERRYLKAVLRPFRKRIAYVKKLNAEREGLQDIIVMLKNNDYLSFPMFRAETMYRGMTVGKRYSLEDLGIRYD